MKKTTISICFLSLLGLSLLFKTEALHYDAFRYWNYGDLLARNNFNIYELDGYRGYVFPAFLAICQWVGGFPAWRLLYALLITVFIERCYYISGKDNSYTKADFLKVGVFASLLFILFKGTITYPLSDLFALICMVLALSFIHRLYLMEDSQYSSAVRYYTYFFVYSVLCGLFSYAAYNVRPIYLFSAIFVLVLYVIDRFRNQHERRRKLIPMYTGAYGVGACASALPQLLMNIKNNGLFTAFVQNEGLMLRQMFWGLQLQRYDTYLYYTTDQSHLTAKVEFIDTTGRELLHMYGLETFHTWGEYIKLFFRHPIDMICIYIRHFVNYLFPCWPEMYIENLHKSKVGWGVLGFTILFCAVLSMLNGLSYNRRAFLYYTCICLPSLFIIPGAVEYRFSIGIYVSCLALLCFNTDWTALINYVKERKLKLSILYVVLLALVLSIWSSMLSNEAVTVLMM
ncbi:MAG: hypothetical protein IJP92_16255 [Lachnospiraceae bacterium]|nr:hypothetical protein [Lachnospiraceae bacterium]